MSGIYEGTHILCLPESSRVKGFFLEFALYIIRDDATTTPGMHNLMNAPRVLQTGIMFGQILPFPATVRIVDDDNHLLSNSCLPATSKQTESAG